MNHRLGKMFSADSLAAGHIGQAKPVSRELVKKITDRVYALLLLDLKIEYERCGRRSGSTRSLYGGR